LGARIAGAVPGGEDAPAAGAASDVTGWLEAITAGSAIRPAASAAVARAGIVPGEIFIATCLSGKTRRVAKGTRRVIIIVG
jgi:hypothetical protein